MADDACTPGRINLSTLAAADLEFTDLAADAQTPELRAAFKLAARIAAAMWRTQAGMLAVVREMERGSVSAAQAAASLRYVLQRGA
jgi:hypothetical protein